MIITTALETKADHHSITEWKHLSQCQCLHCIYPARHGQVSSMMKPIQKCKTFTHQNEVEFGLPHSNDVLTGRQYELQNAFWNTQLWDKDSQILLYCLPKSITIRTWIHFPHSAHCCDLTWLRSLWLSNSYAFGDSLSNGLQLSILPIVWSITMPTILTDFLDLWRLLVGGL